MDNLYYDIILGCKSDYNKYALICAIVPKKIPREELDDVKKYMPNPNGQ